MTFSTGVYPGVYPALAQGVGERVFGELGRAMPGHSGVLGEAMASWGPWVSVLIAWAMIGAVVAHAVPGAVRRAGLGARAERGPADPDRYGGLEVYRIWVSKGEELEAGRVEEALKGLALDSRDGVSLEAHVGEYTDFVVAGRNVGDTLKALGAQYGGKVQILPVDPEEDPFAPPMRQTLRRALASAGDGTGTGDGTGDGTEGTASPPLPELVEVGREYRFGGAAGWGTRAMADFAKGVDPMDSGVSQIRAALETDRGEAAMVRLFLRPATRASLKHLEDIEEHYKKQPNEGRLGALGWIVVFKLAHEWFRDFARQRGYGARHNPDAEARETPESKRVRDRRNAHSLFEYQLVAYGRVAPARRRALEVAFDKFFAAYEERGGKFGGSRSTSRRLGPRATEAACVRVPGVWPAPSDHAEVLNEREVAAMWHPLGAEAQAHAVRESLVITVPPPANLPKTGVMLARSNYPGLERPVNMTHAVLSEHGRMLGLAGTGKTAGMFRLGEAILRTPGEFHDRMGMFLMDPKNDLFNAVLGSIASGGVRGPGGEDLREKTLVLDAGHEGVTAPGMNLLAPQAWMSPHKQATALVDAFYARFASIGWGANMQQYLQNSMFAMIGANAVLVRELREGPRFTLLDLSSNRFLAPREERGKDDWDPAPMRAEVLRILQGSKDAHRYADVIRFWSNFDSGMRATTQKAEVNPVTNKINQLFNESIAGVFGAPHCDVDFLSMMKDGTIFLVNVSKANFGEDGAALFGSMLLNMALEASKHRYDKFSRGLDPDRPREFPFLIDEVQDFACPEMKNIINQARAYRTPLWVAHQQTAQLSDREIAEAIEGVGTQLYFRTTQKDAARVAKTLGDPFTPVVVENMAKFNFVTRGQLGRVSCATVPIYPDDSAEARAGRTRLTADLRRESSERYATEWDPEEFSRERAARYGSAAARRPSPPPPAGPASPGGAGPADGHPDGAPDGEGPRRPLRRLDVRGMDEGKDPGKDRDRRPKDRLLDDDEVKSLDDRLGDIDDVDDEDEGGEDRP